MEINGYKPQDFFASPEENAGKRCFGCFFYSPPAITRCVAEYNDEFLSKIEGSTGEYYCEGIIFKLKEN